MRTVLVTGGAGFLGSHLVERLLDWGAAVRVLDNLSTGSVENLRVASQRESLAAGSASRAFDRSRLEVIIGDIRDRELLRKALRGVNYVFHLAALPSSAISRIDLGETHSVNVEGTFNVLQGALTEGVWRVVLASSASVYGIPEALPVSEQTVIRPTSLFAASKVAAEIYGRTFYTQHQLETVTLRYFSVYGPRQRISPDGVFISGLIESLRQGRSLERDDSRAEDFIYVDDAVGAALAAAWAPRAAGRIINVGSGELVTIGEVLNILTTLLQTAVVPGLLPRNPDPPPTPIYAQTGLAAQLLDFVPRISLTAGLARTLHAAGHREPLEFPTLAPATLDD